MKRFVSVWLPDFAIERLRRMWRRETSLQGLSAPLQNGGAGEQELRESHHERQRHPLALTEAGPYGVTVIAINQAARRAGLQAGLSMSDAKAIYPALLTLPLDREGNASALRDMGLWLGRYGPNRNVDGDDGLWVEITGVAHLFDGEEALLKDLLSRLASVGLTAQAGLADTYGAAHALARYGCDRSRKFTIAPPGEVSKATDTLPVDGLRLTEDSLLLLKRLGLHRIGQVTAIPRSAMAQRFRDDAKGARRQDREALARAVVWRLDQLSGELVEPKTALEPPPHRTRRILFAEPLISTEGIASAVTQAVEGLSEDLAEIGEGATGVRLSLFRADGTIANLDIGVSRPSRNPEHLLKLFAVKLPEVDAGLGIDVVVVAALRVARLDAVQGSLQSRACTSEGEVAAAELIDRLSNRLGRAHVKLLGTAESHWPERALTIRPAQEMLQRRNQWGASKVRHHAARASLVDCAPRQRPQFLLVRPEPIDVLAALPEGPPARFRWRRRQCRVRLASRPERITPEWWTELAGRETSAEVEHDDVSTPASTSDDPQGVQENPQPRTSRPRDYYVLEDSTGSRFWVFREGLYQRPSDGDERPPQWFMHGVFA